MSNASSSIDWEHNGNSTDAIIAAEVTSTITELSAGDETPVGRRQKSDTDRYVGNLDSTSRVWVSRITTSFETSSQVSPEAKLCIGQSAIRLPPHSGGNEVKSTPSPHTLRTGAETTVETRTQSVPGAQVEPGAQTKPRVVSETRVTLRTVSRGLI